MRKIIVAPDSFKGSLSAAEVSAAIADAIGRVCPAVEVIENPLSDGGDGFVELVERYVSTTAHLCTTTDALGRTIQARWLSTADGTAIIESAAACGITLLQPSEKDPMHSSTRGVARLIDDAMRQGLRHIIVGLGGSATNDGGTGLLCGLGYTMLDHNGRAIEPNGENLVRIAHIDSSAADPRLKECTLEVVTDVSNPLCGVKGASRTFARQKGATDHQIELLEEGMANWSRVLGQYTATDINSIEGGGAAGGVGAAMLTILGGKMRRGAEYLIERSDLRTKMHDAQLVITGEGRVDSQTLGGKVASSLLQEAKAQGVRIAIIGGRVENAEDLYAAGFDYVAQITPEGQPLSLSMQKPTAQANIGQSIARLLATI